MVKTITNAKTPLRSDFWIVPKLVKFLIMLATIDVKINLLMKSKDAHAWNDVLVSDLLKLKIRCPR